MRKANVQPHRRLSVIPPDLPAASGLPVPAGSIHSPRAASYARNGSVSPEMPVPFVPALPFALMLISFLKSYYSGLMVGMGEVSQECRSVWQ
jgi:hypothetical protein